MPEQSTSEHKSFEQLLVEHQLTLDKPQLEHLPSLDQCQLEHQLTLDKPQLEHLPSFDQYLPLPNRPSSDRSSDRSSSDRLPDRSLSDRSPDRLDQSLFGPEEGHPDSLFWEIKRISTSIDPFLSSEEDSIMSQTEPLFTFCGCFDGKGTISAARWLLKLEHELTQYRENGIIPPDRFINSVNLLLTDDAAEWAETNLDAARLLEDEDPTTESVASFRTLFQERFPAKRVESPATNFHSELGEFRQGSNETISSYHKRLLNLMSRVAAKDRPITGRLSLLEEATLGEITKAFARGLHDGDVRRETLRGLTTSDRSLREIVSIAENADRSKRELRKIMEEENRSVELEFYKNMVAKTTPKERIESMLAQYRAGSDRAFHFDSSLDRPMTAPPAAPSTLPPLPTFTPAASFKPAPLGDSSGNQAFPTRFQNQGQNSRWPRRGGGTQPSGDHSFHKPQPRNIPDASASRNAFVNGTRT